MLRPTTHRRTLLAALGTALAAPAVSQPRAFRIVVGFPPGGSADITARLLADRLRAGYAPNAIVENRPGAAGRLAVEHVRAAEPDGTTALLTPASMLTIFPHLYPRTLRYDPFADLAPVSPAGEFPFGVATGPQAGSAASLAELVAWGRGRRDIPFSAAAAGSRPHFMGVQFAQAAGLSMNFIPYRGSAEVIPALMAGDLACSWHPMVDLVAHAEAGRIRIAAVSSARRLARAPNLPTFAEQGFPQLTGSEWFGLFLPARTPSGIVDALHAALIRIMAGDDYGTAIARLEMVPAPMTPGAFAARIREEHAAWAPIIAGSGFRPEEG